MPSSVLLLDAQDGSTTRGASEEARASSPRRAWKRWEDARIVGIRGVDSTPCRERLGPPSRRGMELFGDCVAQRPTASCGGKRDPLGGHDTALTPSGDGAPGAVVHMRPARPARSTAKQVTWLVHEVTKHVDKVTSLPDEVTSETGARGGPTGARPGTTRASGRATVAGDGRSCSRLAASEVGARRSWERGGARRRSSRATEARVAPTPVWARGTWGRPDAT
jgi:hypothetical protein